MNKKGFTLIELLAVILIIAVVSGIAIISVTSNIDLSKRATFADKAKLYVEKASEDRAKDRLPHDIKDGEALLLPLSRYKLDADEEYETPFGHLNLDYSYVILTNNKNQYSYYVYIVDDSNHGIVGVEYSSINKDSVTDETNQLSSILNYRNLDDSSRYNINGTLYKLKDSEARYVVLQKVGA